MDSQRQRIHGENDDLAPGDRQQSGPGVCGGDVTGSGRDLDAVQRSDERRNRNAEGDTHECKNQHYLGKCDAASHGSVWAFRSLLLAPFLCHLAQQHPSPRLRFPRGSCVASFA